MTCLSASLQTSGDRPGLLPGDPEGQCRDHQRRYRLHRAAGHPAENGRVVELDVLVYLPVSGRTRFPSTSSETRACI